MKKSFVALSAAAALTWLVGCQPKQATWQLVWEENFDQTEHFDEATWSKIPRGTFALEQVHVRLRLLLRDGER